MAIILDHTIVHVRDAAGSAAFLVAMLDLPPPRRLAHFTIVQVGETSLDLLETDDAISSRHFAFRVTEPEFDSILARLQAQGQAFWADPFHQEPGRINQWDDGRGVYFDDPNGHLLEIITRPYGSGGLTARHPNPLLLR
jgi:catechol 2,3-dioxygenase-like lactoylglutathione lyase family enzyme